MMGISLVGNEWLRGLAQDCGKGSSSQAPAQLLLMLVGFPTPQGQLQISLNLDQAEKEQVFNSAVNEAQCNQSSAFYQMLRIRFGVSKGFIPRAEAVCANLCSGPFSEPKANNCPVLIGESRTVAELLPIGM